MSQQDFVKELEDLGFKVEKLDDETISFPYTIPVGKHTGKKVDLGFIVAQDYPASPPATGPHVSPKLLQIKSGGEPPLGGVHESQRPAVFDAGWQYWSRPCNHWNASKRNARVYMAFIRRLFEDLP